MRFEPKRLADWTAEVDADKAPRWLLKDFIAADSLTMLSGHPKALGKKTLLAMIQGLSLASGERIEAFEPVAQVPVLYCYHEGARKATRHRIRMLVQGAGLKEEALTDFWFSHRSLMDLRVKDDVAAIGQWCKTREIGLVIFDTLAKSMQGSEDCAENVGRVVRGVEEARSYGTSVLILHHLTKSAGNSIGGRYDPDRDMRGSGALGGSYETHQAVRHYGYNNKKADLLISNKDDQEFAHKHWWEFVNEEDPGACFTRLHMGPRTSWDAIGDLDSEETHELLEFLSPGISYTTEMLAALWKVNKQVAQEILAKLIQTENMENSKYGFAIRE